MKESVVVIVDCLPLNLKQSNLKILREHQSSFILAVRRTLVVLYHVRLEDAPCSRKHKFKVDIWDFTNPVASGKATFQLLIIEVNIAAPNG